VYVPIQYLPICADTELFFPEEEECEKEYDWIFVGNSRFVKRKSVMWSIANQIPLNIWGANWETILPDSEKYVRAVNIPNDDLPDLYRNAKVTVDDHYEDMTDGGFINTRIIEALACGLPIISDYSKTLEMLFGDAILYYRTEEEFVEQTKRIQTEYDAIKKKIKMLWPVIQEQYSFAASAEKLSLFLKQSRIQADEYERIFQTQCLFREEDSKIQPVVKGRLKNGCKVSIILAVYQAEKYLCACMDSILSQTLKEIELIGIDDGSTDASLDILRAYAKKDERVSVYTQENAGLSVVRNRGLYLASGEYVYFMDSDDWLERNAMEQLYQQSAEESLDLLIFDGVTEYETNMDQRQHPEYEGYYRRSGQYPKCCLGQEMFVRMRKTGEYRTSAVMQFFKREFLTGADLSFLPGILHEDNAFTFCALLMAKRAGYQPQAHYHRRVHEDSIMTGEKDLLSAYGYFQNFVMMLSFAQNLHVSNETGEMIYDVLKGVLHNAKTKYAKLSVQKQRVFVSLSGSEKLLFELCVQSGTEVSGSANGICKENAILQQKLQRTYAEKSEINRKLQQTYAEKSEINRKLQITYGEKYERGIEIKRLKRRIVSIQNSKTYKLARIIGFPVRMLRNMRKKRQR
jgi:glycosyltransferase involved in cell wall biosynthesis